MKSIFRFVVLSFAISVLAGCATSAELRVQPLERELNSTFPARMVSMCIADRWEKASPFGGTVPVKMGPIEGGYTISWRVETWGHTGMLAEVKESPDGSLTHYFKNEAMGEGVFDKIVGDCQDPTKAVEATTTISESEI